jgi:hypothetical protein
MKDTGADKFSQGVVGCVSSYGGNYKHHKQQFNLKNAERGHRTQGKKEGIPGEYRGYHQTSFTKNDNENNQIGPKTKELYDRVQVPVQVNKKI